MAVHPVGHGAAQRGQQKNRDLAREAHHAEQCGRTSEPVDQPGLRHRLHPGSDERNQLAADEEPVIAVAEGSENAAELKFRLGH